MEDYHRGIFMHLLFVEPCTPFLTFPPCVHLSLCSLCPPLHTPLFPPPPPSFSFFIFPSFFPFFTVHHLPIYFSFFFTFLFFFFLLSPTAPFTPLHSTTPLI